MEPIPSIRMNATEDAPGVLAIYGPVVLETVISFEYEPPTVEEMSQRIAATLEVHPWLVADADGVIAGYAYASAHRQRTAYAWSVDTSVYVGEAWRGRGVGRALYEDLLKRLTGQGYVNVYAGIALPNDASVRITRRAGSSYVGVFPSVGFKFGE
jgi:L-amino acid N-acyltransferase YncA